MLRVLVTDHVSGDLSPETAVLEPLGAELVLAPRPDKSTQIDLAAAADALLVCCADPAVGRRGGATAHGHRIRPRTGIGYDNVDGEAATEHGIVVTNVPDYCLDEVADQSVLLLLAFCRHLTMATDSVRAGG